MSSANSQNSDIAAAAAATDDDVADAMVLMMVIHGHVKSVVVSLSQHLNSCEWSTLGRELGVTFLLSQCAVLDQPSDYFSVTSKIISYRARWPLTMDGFYIWYKNERAVLVQWRRINDLYVADIILAHSADKASC